MIQQELAHPRIASYNEWLELRKELLEEEKELTHHKDRVNAKRRRLPMVEVEKEYVFEGPDGARSLLDLFENKKQLIVHHFMFHPEWERGCSGCTGHVDGLGDISNLDRLDTRYVAVSRAPYPKLEAFKRLKNWNIPWYSSFGSDFNYDYHVTLDENVAPVEYNYRSKAEMLARNSPNPVEGEEHGFSVFFRIEDKVFHTYSTYARGAEEVFDTLGLLDITPYGRQEDFEDSPEGWPQRPTYG
jgi:predicted dithiol-disulfide oxidoreductase (DUF899 family)